MIVVTGATGKLGRAIVESLAKRVAAAEIVATSREPEKAEALAKLGVRVRHADYAEPDTLAEAFAGATQVLLISSNARAFGGDTLAQHRAAIAAAKAAGAKRVLYTSHMAASATSAFAPVRDHAATEEMLRASGIAWTSLRNGFYATSGIAMVSDAFTNGVLDVPADGPVSWTAHADLADAAAAILANEGRFEGPTPPLTGAEALDFAALTKLGGAIVGKAIEQNVISDDDFRASMLARKVPPAVVDIALGYYVAARNGEFATVDPTLAQLVGRAPITAREVLAEKLAR